MRYGRVDSENENAILIPQELEAYSVTNADDALAAAEAAEAEAAEAEAAATAARARARAIRLRQEAEAAAKAKADTEAEVAVETPAEAPVEATTDVEPEEVESSAVELDEPAEAVEVAPKGRRNLRPGSGFLRVAAATVAVLAVAGLLALSATMYVQHKNVETQQRLTAEFAAAARQGVVTLMSLDHTKAKEDVQGIIDVTTGDFKKDFESQAEDMIKVAEQNKVVTQVTVNAIGVQQQTADTATVLLAAMSTVSNAASDKQEPRAWRLSVDVARDGDQIKLAKVEFVP